jgi:ketosteroid isomerase-like protein
MNRSTLLANALIVAFAASALSRCAASSASAASSPQAERDIRELESRYVAAWLRFDEPFIERTTAPNATWINGTGRLANKTESLEIYRSGRIHLDSSEETDLAVRIYGDAAVVTGVWNIRGTLAGRQQSGRMRFTRVWVRTKDGWQMASWQGTPLANP